MSLSFSSGKIKVFVSSVSLDKEIKLRQQRVVQCLEARHIPHSVADLASSASDKRELRVLMMGNPKPPPQIFNGNDYCGDYAAFCLALEDEILEEFLKLKEPNKSKKDIQTSSSTERKEVKKVENDGKSKITDETEKVQQTVRNLGKNVTALIDKEKEANENMEGKTPIFEAGVLGDKSEDDDESGAEGSEKLLTKAKSQKRNLSPTAQTRDGLKSDTKTNVSSIKEPSTHVPPPLTLSPLPPQPTHAPPPTPPTHAPPPPPPPPPPTHAPPPPPPTHAPPPPPPPPIQAPSASSLKTDIKPLGDVPQLPKSLLEDIRSSTKLKPVPKSPTKLPAPRKDAGKATGGTAAPTKEVVEDSKPKFSADELFKGRMALKSKYDRSIPKTANLAPVKGNTSDSKKTSPSVDKISSIGKNLPRGSGRPEASLASVLTASRSKK